MVWQRVSRWGRNRHSTAEAEREEEPFLPSEAVPPDPADAGILMYAAERDSLLGGELTESILPEDVAALAFRDPFSADFIEFQKDQAEKRRHAQRSIDGELRADLLAKPYLMAKPTESGSRGAAAVWRSLRDILHRDSATLMDSSGTEELVMLRRELKARKVIVEAVAAGLDNQLQRLEQRIAAARGAEGEAERPGSTGGTSEDEN